MQCDLNTHGSTAYTPRAPVLKLAIMARSSGNPSCKRTRAAQEPIPKRAERGKYEGTDL